MSIESHPFGAVILTGDDARAFERQINDSAPPSREAVETMRLGRELYRRFRSGLSRSECPICAAALRARAAAQTEGEARDANR